MRAEATKLPTALPPNPLLPPNGEGAHCLHLLCGLDGSVHSEATPPVSTESHSLVSFDRAAGLLRLCWRQARAPSSGANTSPPFYCYEKSLQGEGRSLFVRAAPDSTPRLAVPRERAERIRRNREMMSQLGVLSAAEALAPAPAPAKAPRRVVLPHATAGRAYGPSPRELSHPPALPSALNSPDTSQPPQAPPAQGARRRRPRSLHPDPQQLAPPRRRRSLLRPRQAALRRRGRRRGGRRGVRARAGTALPGLERPDVRVRGGGGELRVPAGGGARTKREGNHPAARAGRRPLPAPRRPLPVLLPAGRHGTDLLSPPSHAADVHLARLGVFSVPRPHRMSHLTHPSAASARPRGPSPTRA